MSDSRWASLLASGIIAANGVRLLKRAVAEIMDEAPSVEFESRLREVAVSVQDVLGIEKCRIRKSGLGYFGEIHVEVDENITVRQGHDIGHHVKDTLMKSNLGVLDALIHIEPKKNPARKGFFFKK